MARLACAAVSAFGSVVVANCLLDAAGSQRSARGGEQFVRAKRRGLHYYRIAFRKPALERSRLGQQPDLAVVQGHKALAVGLGGNVDNDGTDSIRACLKLAVRPSLQHLLVAQAEIESRAIRFGGLCKVLTVLSVIES